MYFYVVLSVFNIFSLSDNVSDILAPVSYAITSIDLYGCDRFSIIFLTSFSDGISSIV